MLCSCMQANWFWEVTTTGKWSASSKTISVSDSLFNDFHIYVEFGVYLFFCLVILCIAWDSNPRHHGASTKGWTNNCGENLDRGYHLGYELGPKLNNLGP